jgi:TM2 domain-containing membrane protein YozV
MLVAVLPAVAAAVAFVFAGQLVRQYGRRHRPHALAWGLALALFGVASAMVTVGVSAGWNPVVFGTYWIAGALLNVPLLGVGQLMLLDPGRAVLYWTLAGVFAVWAVAFTLLASFDGGVLAAATAERAIPLGKEVLGGTTAYRLVGPFNAMFLVVVGGSLWSAARNRRPQVLLIALGISVVAGGSSAVGAGRDFLFSLLLAAGVTIMYVGFRAASKPPRQPAQPVTP